MYITEMGGALDIACGQLIDRVGAAAVLCFPSGHEMEFLYTKCGAKRSVNVEELGANLSGAETQALGLLKDGYDSAYICSGVIDCVANMLMQLIINVKKLAGIKKFIFTGDVICNTIIRE